jgi:F-type H+-transporting ATPase subunit c
MSISKKLSAMALPFVATLFVPLAAFAQDSDKSSDPKAWAAAGAGIAIGLAVLGGALGQGRAASAALEGISRNPGASGKIFTPMILGLALIESLVLFALLIAWFLQAFATK